MFCNLVYRMLPYYNGASYTQLYFFYGAVAFCR